MPYEPDAYNNPPEGRPAMPSAAGSVAPSRAPVGPPMMDVMLAAQQVWQAIDAEIDDRIGPQGPHPPRLYGANYPFGVKGTAVDTGAGPIYLVALGFDVPTALVGWRLWVQPAGSITLDVRRVQPQASPPVAETSIVGTSGGPSITGGTYAWSDDLSAWSTNDLVFNRNDIMTVYITASTTVQYGLFRFRLRDLTLREPT